MRALRFWSFAVLWILATALVASEPPLPWPDLPPENSKARAEAALRGDFIELEQAYTLPRRADGHYDWEYGGPDKDKEWAWMNNRLLVLPALYEQWQATGERRYIDSLNAVLVDWIQANPYPDSRTFSAPWRALESARRVLDSWIPLYYQHRQTPFLTAEAESLMRESLADHAHNLRHHASRWGGNHLLTELTALAVITASFPDIDPQAEWSAYASERIEEEILSQTYPDGAFKELTNHYQRVVLQNVQRYLNLLRASGRTVSPELLQRVEAMWNYYAYVMRPNGQGPLNSASDLEDNLYYVRPVVDDYERPDWLYVGTNGEEGTRPPSPPSRYFQYAGHAVLRSGWDWEAAWIFFDMGPHGSAHQHDDSLHLSMRMSNQDYLVDSGRYQYLPGTRRDHFTGARAHNTVLLNGHSSRPPPKVAQRPLPRHVTILPEDDFVSSYAVFPAETVLGKGQSVHRRGIYHLRDEYVIILDHIQTYGQQKVDVLWHFHPDLEVNRVFDVLSIKRPESEERGMRFTPLIPAEFTYHQSQGDEDPEWPSWYSPNYNIKRPSTLARFEVEVFRPLWMAWIIPLSGGRADPFISTRIDDALSPVCTMTLERRSGYVETLRFGQSSYGIQILDTASP